jgi:hypothetical protein
MRTDVTERADLSHLSIADLAALIEYAVRCTNTEDQNRAGYFCRVYIDACNEMDKRIGYES